MYFLKTWADLQIFSEELQEDFQHRQCINTQEEKELRIRSCRIKNKKREGHHNQYILFINYCIFICFVSFYFSDFVFTPISVLTLKTDFHLFLSKLFPHQLVTSIIIILTIRLFLVLLKSQRWECPTLNYLVDVSKVLMMQKLSSLNWSLESIDWWRILSR